MVYLRIYIDGDTTTIRGKTGQKLIDLLPQISSFLQKKATNKTVSRIDPKKYYYFYHEGQEPLSMQLTVDNLKQKELELRLKVCVLCFVCCHILGLLGLLSI